MRSPVGPTVMWCRSTSGRDTSTSFPSTPRTQHTWRLGLPNAVFTGDGDCDGIVAVPR